MYGMDIRGRYSRGAVRYLATRTIWREYLTVGKRLAKSRIVSTVTRACKMMDEAVKEFETSGEGGLRLLEERGGQAARPMKQATFQAAVDATQPEVGHGLHACACGSKA